MLNNQDPLNQLWQQQKTEKPDYDALQNSWNKMRIKQKWYVFIDVCSVMLTFTIIWFNQDRLDNFTLSLMSVVLLLSVFVTLYLTWLRRFALGWSNLNTTKHIQQLKKQVENNIKIASLSQHSVWVISILMVLFYGGLYIYEVFPPDKFLNKVLITLAIHSIMLPSVWIWAKKRKQRFMKELTDLQALENEQVY
ncbi:hypothetical protein [Paraglaciecola sp. 2405UD69-4]|uniref:hypothetical protein n=1 Tax=Paraglaciecola sp. 2405UD69-4 TaxID=3391836 RepID=UPI0039C9B8F5